MKRLLIINPGSTSTKIAVFEGQNPVYEKKINHTVGELARYEKIFDQKGFRKDAILGALSEAGLKAPDFDCIVGRGGLLDPIESGTYIVDENMLTQLKSEKRGSHASNLGAILAWEIGSPHGIPAYITDPVVVDELQDVARLSGHPDLPRASIFHALNHKAVGRRAASEMGKKYEDCNFVVAHLGGGISVGAHRKGRCIDVNDALGGEGAYSPERAGGLPAPGLVEMCFSGLPKDEVKKKLVGRGGMTAYLGTNDGTEIAKRIKNGDEYADLIFKGMAYQVAKEIGAYSAVLSGDVDAIILTGGLAYDEGFTSRVAEMASFIAPIRIYPGEDEMLALCEGALRVLSNVEEAKTISFKTAPVLV